MKVPSCKHRHKAGGKEAGILPPAASCPCFANTSKLRWPSTETAMAHSSPPSPHTHTHTHTAQP